MLENKKKLTSFYVLFIFKPGLRDFISAIIPLL